MVMEDDMGIEEEIISFSSKLHAPYPLPRQFLEDLDWCPILVRENEELIGISFLH